MNNASNEVLVVDTANDRMKKSFPVWVWSSVFGAVVIHVLVLNFWPTLLAEDMGFAMDEMTAIAMPPEVEIPPPPEAIQRPANPVVTAAQINQDVTISLTTFEDNLPSDLPPPPAQSGQVDISAQPTFTPYEVNPEVRNVPAVQSALEREYPRTLRDQRIGGTVVMHMFISQTGVVENCQVATSSGYTLLDDAGLRVCPVFNFVPARNMDQPVPVWVQIPITFTAR